MRIHEDSEYQKCELSSLQIDQNNGNRVHSCDFSNEFGGDNDSVTIFIYNSGPERNETVRLKVDSSYYQVLTEDNQIIPSETFCEMT